MPVLRVELTGIEAKRYMRPNERVGQIKVEHNNSVTSIRETGPNEASVEFRYTISYGAMGSVRVEGTIVYQGDAKKIEEHWRTSSQMPNEIANEIHNSVFRRCVPDAVWVAHELLLPPPVMIPVANVQAPQASAKAGPSHGPEVM